MTSIVAGSTYLLAPPPKSYSRHNLIASLLCRPLAHPHLLLQLQHKDSNSRRAFPHFDLVCRKSSRAGSSRNPDSAPFPQARQPREVVVQHSETLEKVATIKYASALSLQQKKKMGIAADDDSIIAAVYWHYAKSFTKVWTVHRYETNRRGAKIVGYEFRMRSDSVRGRDGNGYAYVRWTRRVIPAIQDRPQSVNSRRRRSSSVSSSETQQPRRRHTFPDSPPSRSASQADVRWEFSSPSVRRILASMTPQKLHIHSISSSGTPLSSPSCSDFDDDLHSDRDLTPGKMFEILIITGLFVGLEENFASKLRAEFLSAGGLRVPPSDDLERASVYDTPSPSPRRHRPASVTPTPPLEQTPQLPPLSPHPSHRLVNTRSATTITLRMPQIPPVSYAAKGWGFVTAAAAVCITKIMGLGA